ncbi:hypothetical protein SDC9_181126 [bioreactor metagenome]|uniref:Uncharacterized protein n=1 Tax=bioreactor metagenome TaxID=1076179 RepID=A0A645H576_9ZZZZ
MISFIDLVIASSMSLLIVCESCSTFVSIDPISLMLSLSKVLLLGFLSKTINIKTINAIKLADANTIKAISIKYLLD